MTQFSATLWDVRMNRSVGVCVPSPKLSCVGPWVSVMIWPVFAGPHTESRRNAARSRNSTWPGAPVGDQLNVP